MNSPADKPASDAERDDLIERICTSAFEAGHWETLPEDLRGQLRAKWRPQLEAYDLAYLRELASRRAGTPTVLTDEAFNLHIAVEAKRRPTAPGGNDDLSSFIRDANAIGMLVHGFDPKFIPAWTDAKSLDRHVAVIGASGMGKTNLMANLFIQLSRIKDEKGRYSPMVLIDPHAQLINEVLPNLPQDRWKDVVVIDPSKAAVRSWGMNIMQVAHEVLPEDTPNYAQALQQIIDEAAATTVHALSVLQADRTGFEAGASIQSLLNMLLLAATEREDTSFVDAYGIVSSKDILDQMIHSIARHYVRDYFRFTFNDLSKEYKERARNKLDIFLNTIVMATVCRRDECVSLKTLIEQGKIVVFDLDTQKISRPVAQLLGYLLLLYIQFVVDKRVLTLGGSLPQLHVMVDEFSLFASKSTAAFLSEARKKRAGIIMGFQHLGQLDDSVRKSLGNAATWCVFRPTDDDADFLCKRLGLLNEMGKPKVEQLMELPQWVMRLQFDRWDNEGPVRANIRDMLTVRTLPPMPKPRNAAEILQRMRERSDRLYYKPFNPSDARTVYTDDVGARHALEAIYEANLAIRRPDTYLLTDQSVEKAVWALENRVVTASLVEGILRAKGISVSTGRAGQLIRSLNMRELVRYRKLMSGYQTTELTRLGLDEVGHIVAPARAANEGGALHRATLLDLYTAINATTSVQLDVPSQVAVERDYTPDLVGIVPGRKAPGNWFNGVTDRARIHFQVEVSTRTRPDHVYTNVARALKEDALPIVVVPILEFDRETLVGIREFHAAIVTRLAQSGTLTLRSGEPAWGGKVDSLFRLWAVSKEHVLYELDAARNVLVPVLELYAERRVATPPHQESGHPRHARGAGREPQAAGVA